MRAITVDYYSLFSPYHDANRMVLQVINFILMLRLSRGSDGLGHSEISKHLRLPLFREPQNSRICDTVLLREVPLLPQHPLWKILLASVTVEPFRCVYCILLISSFWIMEVVPIGITSLLPVLLFPVLGISSAKEICLVYFKDSIVLFICTLSMALAVEETNLHKRIALKLLCKVGTRKQTKCSTMTTGKKYVCYRMLLGFMATTTFLSFFVSDTACTALMIPIALAIISSVNETTDISDGKVDENTTECIELGQLPKDQRGFCKWMAFAMPAMVLCLLASYTVLMVWSEAMLCSFMGPRHLFLWCSSPSEDERRISQAVGKRVKAAYDSLGDFT
ncbi:hypothetical protein ANCCEY_05203 [Ancylostoma ceylanicum]|uniref:Uncharacterized protein n=1 Tax=Ancylostoma ceylanicum TaxID=53326 RepID=A0A0D6M027_9BILA|nr:hypothetical protein ANCCEY_05203 [Ancylostoma ceylanicum]